MSRISYIERRERLIKAGVPIVKDWKAEPLPGRLNLCVKMLVVHGLLTDAEAAKVRRRIAKEMGAVE